jgi:hypothetical protein
MESPTTTRDQGVSVGTEVSAAVDTGVKAVAQPLNKTNGKINARKIDPTYLFITSSPYDFIDDFIVVDAG